MPQATRGLGLELKKRKKEWEGSDSDEEVKNSSTSYIPPAGLKSKETCVESQSRVCVN